MSVEDLVWKLTDGLSTIYDPAVLDAGEIGITITNAGEDNLTDLGLYITPASNIGDVLSSVQASPESDYQELLLWGTEKDLAIETYGGMAVEVPANVGGPDTYIITRTVGAGVGTKIPFKDIAAGDSEEFTIFMEAPTGEPARRFFVDLVMA